MSGLLWLLVVFEGQESESESLAGMTEINTSLVMTGGFSWDDSSSSAGVQTQYKQKVDKVMDMKKKTDVPCPWM